MCDAEEQTTLASDERVDTHTSSESILITDTPMTVTPYGVIVGLLLIIIFLLSIIVACTVCNVRSRKMIKAIKGKQLQKFYLDTINTKIAIMFQQIKISTTLDPHSMIIMISQLNLTMTQ